MKLELFKLNLLENNIFQLIEKYISENQFMTPPIIYLEGGHYDPRYEISDFSLNSLTHVLNISNNLIVKHKGDIKIVIGILVDNLGLSCNENTCEITNHSETIKNNDTLPEEIEKILNKYLIVKREKIIISNEKNCKNKTISFLKKSIKLNHDSITIEDKNGVLSILYHAQDNQFIQLAEIKNDVIWIAKCPSIMAQHYSNITDKILKRFNDASDITIIDFSESEDMNKVTRGVEVAVNVYIPTVINTERVNIHNVFMTDYGDNQYTIANTFSKLHPLNV
ncbi:hypothetical protein OIU83_05370 [Flavobacterium sp. LS1R49]|uniref:Uncharacterized protein n=1 Tax=Flavobacterium shii TaxID=2987687 RepID=A0A9X2ZG72_9FLAO|nr:hypothetical protein [Flavobacterium shii]MCV9927068.1 hypothetical protein [Flavobacterium shii]